ALSMALDLLVLRTHGRRAPVQFSPAWIHRMSGQALDDGRSLTDGVNSLRQSLPCAEAAFPYAQLFNDFNRWWHKNQSEMSASSGQLTQRFGRVIAEELDPSDISGIKARMAAG